MNRTMEEWLEREIRKVSDRLEEASKGPNAVRLYYETQLSDLNERLAKVVYERSLP